MAEGDDIGPVERSVRQDIAALGPLTSGVRRTLAQMAYALAGRLDRAYIEDAGLSTIAKANQELRSTLVEVTRTADDNSRADAFAQFLASPELARAAVGDTARPVEADSRPADGDGGAAVGPAADAVAAPCS